ncbi:hypothetical protein [Sedimentitalea todarodis]|uniref:Uncharacterized protein n=1 Tax=Sedimentitalea todarodis TaxID=1631240 RepID=A0ABU3VEG5_9RHOB|nr:hypothetical protein [Sedimentitalea todarodis]MDU9004572.1 hypothetical protein [Sedimentitalea todarodis]
MLVKKQPAASSIVALRRNVHVIAEFFSVCGVGDHPRSARSAALFRAVLARRNHMRFFPMNVRIYWYFSKTYSDIHSDNEQRASDAMKVRQAFLWGRRVAAPNRPEMACSGPVLGRLPSLAKAS